MTERRAAGAPDPSDAIAVIGVGAAFPGAMDAHGFWQNIVSGHDAITEVPEGRWDPVFYDPGSSAVDRVYCRRGGFLGSTLDFDAGAFGIMPVAAKGAEPDQLLALSVAAATLADAGCEPGARSRRRTAVVLGRGSYVTAGMVRLEQKVRGAQQLVSFLSELVPDLEPEVLDRIKRAAAAQAGIFGPDTAIGLVPNLAASRIANRLDLQGPAYTLDAACASSLIAVEHGVRELRAGRSDLALVGGVHMSQDITFWSVFAQLGALSRNQKIRPFSADADGLLIGEGVGMVLLERLDDALAQDRRIYAVLEGVGSASDGRASSVMVPRVAGQVLALERAWRDAGVDPRTVGLIEAHGTATSAGDAAEIATLRQVFGAEGCELPVGSVKSMIGHAMPAAGAAGLIKAVLALHHRTVPPSLHCDTPNPDLADTRFVVPGEAREWHDPDGPRRAVVNAFGFGGINGHLVLREAPERRRRKQPAPSSVQPVALAAASPEALLEALKAGQRRGGEGPCRLAILQPTPKNLARAEKIVAKAAPWRGRGGTWFTPRGLGHDGGEVALMFPGVEARFEPDTGDIADHFDRPRPRFERPRNLEETGMGLVEVGRLLEGVTRDLGVPVTSMAGHSVGEWTAMMCAGLIDEQDLDAFLGGLSPGTLEVPGVLFAAVGAGVDVVVPALEGLPDIAVSHDNCSHQVLICGAETSVAIAKQRLVERGTVVQVLPFRSGFHSPLLEPYLAGPLQLLGRLSFVTPRLPVWSATLVDHFPDDDATVREVAQRHLLEPVRFRELIEAMYAAGTRIFVQAGTGSLPGFVTDTLGDRPHLAISALGRHRGLDQVRALALALYVEGIPVDLDRVLPAASPRSLVVGLDLRTPLLHATEVLELGTSTPTVTTDDPVMAAFQQAITATTKASREVATAWQEHRRPTVWRTRRTLSVIADPYLRDHAFFPQPDDWTDEADRHPLVPMTMMAEIMWDAAKQLRPELQPVRMEGLRAFKWLAVHPAIDVEIVAKEVSPGIIDTRIEGYAEARVVLAEAFPASPEPSIPLLVDAKPAPVPPERLYKERWMFHGPDYQGVVGLGPFDESGIEGEIVTPPAPGSLLDNAGQVFGYWLMAARDLDRLALPLSLDSIERFGEHPAPGERLACRVSITECTETTLTCDLELIQHGRVWCRIRGWTDRRFPNDPHMWRVMRQPEHHLLSEEGPGWVRFDEQVRRVPSREWISRCFLIAAEREEQLAAGPRMQRDFLHARIVAKDAVRRLLRSEGVTLFPAEIRLDGVSGLLHASVRRHEGRDLRVAVALTDHIAVARATEDASPGIAIVAVEGAAARLAPAMGPLARDLVPSGLGADTVAARLLAAREAAAMAAGVDWTTLTIDTADAERLEAGGTWTTTHHVGDHVIAWTEP